MTVVHTLFLDCEASSLAPGSHPIEIAWCDRKGTVESHLIRPAPDWTDWSEASERLHGISRATLHVEGRPAEEIAARVLAVTQWAVLVSDAPAFDQAWMERLFDAAGRAG